MQENVVEETSKGMGHVRMACTHWVYGQRRNRKSRWGGEPKCNLSLKRDAVGAGAVCVGSSTGVIRRLSRNVRTFRVATPSYSRLRAAMTLSHP